MGLNTSELVFKGQLSSTPSTAVKKIFGKSKRIKKPDFEQIIRSRYYGFAVHSEYEDCGTLTNGVLVKDILENNNFDISLIYKALNSPKILIAYAWYDSGGYFGYAIYLNGKRVRSRVQQDHQERHLAKDWGEPLEIELPWLNAPMVYINEEELMCEIDGEYRNSEYFTGGLLQDVLFHYLGFHILDEAPNGRQFTKVYELADTIKFGKRSEPRTYKVIKPELSNWNWGAFLLPPIWSIFHKSTIGFLLSLLLLVPFINLGVWFALGFVGDTLAWEDKKWSSAEQFKKSKKRWAIAGVVFWMAMIGYSQLL